MLKAIRICIVASVATLAAAAAAQAQEPTTPFVGVVTGDDVYLRAGPSQTYYQVGKVNADDRLHVREIRYGWYMVDPPPDQFSYISMQYVELGDGNTGRVTGDDVRVRAPSPAGPSQSYKIQLKLNRDDQVQVLGTDSGWYKIAPPEGAMLYISGEFVQQATPEQLVETTEPAVEETQETQPVVQEAVEVVEAQPTTTTETADEPDVPAADDTTTTPTEPTEPVEVVEDVTITEPAAEEVEMVATIEPEPAPEPEPATTTADEPDDTVAIIEVEPIDAGDDAATQATEAAATAPVEDVARVDAVTGGDAGTVLADLDQRFGQASTRALTDRPIDALLADYRAAKAGYALSPSQSAIVSARISVLRAWRDLADAQAELAATRQTTDATIVNAADGAAPEYTAVGKLLASTLYTGQQRPLLYRLVDPLTGLTIGYVEPRDDRSLRSMLGQVVGIVGEKRYQPGLKLNIITVKRADALRARSGA